MPYLINKKHSPRF